MSVIELGLAKRDEYPLVGEVFNKMVYLQLGAQGYLDRKYHLDGSTILESYSIKTQREHKWTPITLAFEGMVLRGDRIIARPPGKMWWLNTPELPETMPENFPQREAEITQILDGERLVMFLDASGEPEFAGRDRFFSPASHWARAFYRDRYAKAEWPRGYTPWFWAVGPRWRKVVEYPEDKLILGGLTSIRTGEEEQRNVVDYFASENRIPLVDEWRGSVAAALTAVTGQRGLLLSWARDNMPPIKVGISEIGYQECRTVVETVTPLGIWSLMRDGAELEPLMDRRLPEAFVAWVRGWQASLNVRRREIETEAALTFARMGAPRPEDNTQRKAAVDSLLANTVGREYLMAPVLAMMDRRDIGPPVWEALKREVLGKPGWRTM